MKPKLILILLLVSILALPSVVQAQAKKPNILVIWGDDIGWYNPSIYNRGDMGYWTPNIDRIGKEGAMFTCWMDNRAALTRDFVETIPQNEHKQFSSGQYVGYDFRP
jgi:hypothetical protein